TGAPVTAFCRISDRRIRSHEPIVEPDALIVQDTTLLHQVDLFAGAGPDAYVLIKNTRALDEAGRGDFAASRFRPERVVTVAATDLAREHLGRPLAHAAMLCGIGEASRGLSVCSV